MSDDDLAVLAVLGDPDGDRFVDAPNSHEGMNQLQRQARAAGQGFYCATKLGGCGERVTVVNGTMKRPHFRHLPGQSCPLTPSMARDMYTHLAIQKELVAWLRSLGYDSVRREHWVGPRSRVDVHCEPGAVIEVQLSNETALSQQDRDERYRPRGGNTTWLFDPGRPITSRDAILDRDDVVLLVGFSDPLARPEPGTVRPISIGIRTKSVAHHAFGEDWVPLEECTFTPDVGLQHPKRSEMLERVASAREEQRTMVAAGHTAEFLARLQTSEKARQQSLPVLQRDADEADAKLVAEESDRASANRHLWARPDAPPTSPTDRIGQPSHYPTVWSLNDLPQWEARHNLSVPPNGAWARVLRYHDDLFAGRVYGMNDEWVDGLTEELVDPAWAAVYLLSTSLSGPVSQFIDSEIDTTGAVLDHLQKRGLISLIGGPAGNMMIRVNQQLRPTLRTR